MYLVSVSRSDKCEDLLFIVVWVGVVELTGVGHSFESAGDVGVRWMGYPWSAEFSGRWESQEIESESLKGNPLGDPYVRPTYIYVPPSYDKSDRRYPVVYVLQGMTGQVDMWWNRSAFRKTTPEAIDAVVADPEVQDAIVVLVDAWTSYGGSQYLNSKGTGDYLDYVTKDVVEFVDSNYRTYPKASMRAVMGKSSGGYGAMVIPMLRPNVFGALATHAGDAAFEWSYATDIAQSARYLRDVFDGDYERFWTDFRSRPAFSKSYDASLSNVYAMAACYSTDQDGTVRLPFDPSSGLIDDEVWSRWLSLDPVRMVKDHAEELSLLRGVWIDAGRSDEYFLDVGARCYASRMESIGVSFHFELFEGRHGSIDYRYPMALRYLIGCLTD
ncbi:Putative esterase [Ferrithrix thermotolerans DSM 19514]|uniref:Putative esterase n=1 Tax=Ferrithrix thermotolerans DSM 19514 TaxID=1121881 RepID=A0A1M4VG77_9ACTN|nr:Putative esterase [Ferrithrix thermotolerans DSM 19514]